MEIVRYRDGQKEKITLTKEETQRAYNEIIRQLIWNYAIHYIKENYGNINDAEPVLVKQYREMLLSELQCRIKESTISESKGEYAFIHVHGDEIEQIIEETINEYLFLEEG